MNKNIKKSLQWLINHALTVFSCVAIIAFGMAAIAYSSTSTTIGENISTGGTLTVSSNSTLATTTISGGDLIVDTDTLYVDNDNNRVGIGTTSPWGLLSVNPNGISGPSFSIGSSTKTDFIVTNAGNVGIGTAAPNAMLEIRPTSASYTGNLTEWKDSNGNQLTEIGPTGELSIKKDKSPQALVTFSVDDSLPNTTTKAMFDAQGEVGTVFYQTGNSISDSAAAQLLQYQREGWEIGSHTKTHPHLTSLTEAEIEEELKESKDLLEAAGITVKNFAYPYSDQNAAVRKVARKYYRSARAGTDDFILNSYPLKTYALDSYGYGSDSALLATYKAWVDQAESEGKWLIFFAHTYSWTTEQINTASELIDYIQSKNIPIVTVDQGLDTLGNVFDYKDALDGVSIGANGSLQVGLVSTTASISDSELVTDGDMSVPSSWTAGSGWTVADGWATFGLPAAGNLSQNIIVIGGSSYIVQWDMSLSSANSSSITPKIGAVSGMAISLGSTATSTQQQVITAGASGSLALTFTPAQIGSGSGTIRIDNVSVKRLNPSPASLVLTNSTSGTNLEMRAGGYNYKNTFIGNSAGYANTTGSNNSAVGNQALYSNTTGSYNSAIGDYTLFSNTTGIENLAMGFKTLYSNTSGSYNSAIGNYALTSNTTASSNTALGNYVLRLNTTGSYNSAIGSLSLNSNTTGSSNTALGYKALYYNTTGTYNTAVGYGTIKGTTNITGSSNTAIGSGALSKNIAGSNNSVVGNYALRSNTSGGNNSAIGSLSLNSNTTGSDNLAMGKSALYYNTLAVSNVAIGSEAAKGAASYSNQYITVVGYRSGYKMTTGSNNNTFLGYQSGYENTTGANNLLLGYQAGNNITTGSNNIIIGYDIDAPSATASNQLNIGGLIYGDINGGKVGIGTTTPSNLLDIYSTATTTFKIDSSSTIKGSCLKLKDSDGSGYTYCAVNDGAMNCSSISCE